MDDKEITKKINLDNAIKSDVETNLMTLLEKYDKDYLYELYYVISGKESKLNKKQLIIKVFDLLTNRDCIYCILNNMFDNEYDILCKIIDNNGTIQDDYVEPNDLAYLRYTGLVYLINNNDNIYEIIPNEIMSVLKTIELKELKKIVNDNRFLHVLLNSMLNFYGVVTIDDYLKRCNEFYEDVSFDSIRFLLVRPGFNPPTIYTSSRDIDYLVKSEYLEFNEIYLIDRIVDNIEVNHIPIKEIEIAELLKYDDNCYYKQNKDTDSFKKYLKKIKVKDDNIDLTIGIIIQTLREDYLSLINIVNDIFEDEEYRLSKKDIPVILDFINKILNNLEIWGNNGWTNEEIILKEYLN